MGSILVRSTIKALFPKKHLKTLVSFLKPPKRWFFKREMSHNIINLRIYATND
jgi:hypothetical protein